MVSRRRHLDGESEVKRTHGAAMSRRVRLSERWKMAARRLAAVSVLAVVGVLAAGVLALGVHKPADAASGFTPEADAYVNEANPNTNYGANSQLRVDGSPIVRSYLRFNVQGLSGSATSATLRVYANSSQSVGFDVRGVSSNSWGESSITYNNAPAISPTVADFSGPVLAGNWYELDVTSLVAGNGVVSLALTTSHTTALSLGSRESANAPQLLVDTGGGGTPTPSPTPTGTVTVTPTPTPTPTPGGRLTIISRVGNTYFADSQWGGNDYSGTNLSAVGSSAIYAMNQAGGGTISFQEGIFDLGTGRFDLDFIADIVFEGQGIDNTILRNSTNASMDTEPFDFHVADRVTIRDLTVSAGGAFRSTSDAIDLDAGNNVLIERVKITSSRSRGIVFDGKGTGWTADNNVVRDCIITGVLGDGIELLASRHNRIEGCTISGVGGYGIQITKSSTAADQPNKKSSDNLVSGNIIQNSAQDGINIISSDLSQIAGNSISGSGRDGVRVDSSNSVTCDQNSVTGNAITNSVKWGLNIDDPLCHGTVVNTNSFSGNGSGSIRDRGTGTQY